MLRVGFIGLGNMGRAHARALAAFPDTTVSGVYDPNPLAQHLAATEFGCRVFASPAELADDPDIDAILIASPTDCHLDGLRPAIRSGKPVLCEKPLCRSLDEAEEIVALAASAHERIAIGFVRRHTRAQEEMIRLAVTGALGPVRYCNIDLSGGWCRWLPGKWFADFQRSGGVLLDMLAHHFDLTNQCFGEPASAYAAGLLADPSQPLPADYAAAIITYRNGVIVNAICSWQRYGRSANRMEIFGDLGAVTYSWGERSKLQRVYPDQREETLDFPEELEAVAAEDRNWVDRLQAGLPPKVSLQDGLDALRLSLALIRSAQTRQPVIF